ncbi:MAG: DUF3299 domain-containing protein [Gammaproteobacteria bacterium]
MALLALTGCGEKPSDDPPAAEIRGTPIARPIAKLATNSAARTNPVPPAAASSVPTTARPGYVTANFDKLAGFSFEISDELLGPVTNDLAAVVAKTDAMIPESVHALNNRSVAIKGFMLPLKVESGAVTELLIMRDQSMCCYGVTPKINEWVSVKMKDKGVKALMDQPVTLFGTLRVGEARENGYLVGIYRLEGEKMEAPED